MNFPKLEVTGSVVTNGKKIFSRAIGPSHSNVCLPIPPLSPCISVTHLYAKDHYLKLCMGVGLKLTLIPSFNLKLPCLEIDHGKTKFSSNKYAV